MRNQGIVRGRVFLGFLILFAAVIAWATALLLSPHGEATAPGIESVRTTVAIFLRKSAIGTLVLSALAGWLLWPLRRTPAPRRNWAIAGILALLVATSLYQLIWIETVLN